MRRLANDPLDLLAPSQEEEACDQRARFLPNTPLILFKGPSNWLRLDDLPPLDRADLYHEIVHWTDIVRFVPFNLHYWCCLFDFLLGIGSQEEKGKFVRTGKQHWPLQEIRPLVESQYENGVVRVGYDVFLEANPTYHFLALLIESGEEARADQYVKQWASNLDTNNFRHALGFFIVRELDFRCAAIPWLRDVEPIGTILKACGGPFFPHREEWLVRKLTEPHVFRSYLLSQLRLVIEKGGIIVKEPKAVPLFPPKWLDTLKVQLSSAEEIVDSLLEYDYLVKAWHIFPPSLNSRFRLQDFFAFSHAILLRGLASLFLTFIDWMDVKTQEFLPWDKLIKEVLPAVAVELGRGVNNENPLPYPLPCIIMQLSWNAPAEYHPPILFPGGGTKYLEQGEDLAISWPYFGAVQSLRQWFAGDQLVCPFWEKYKEFCPENEKNEERCAYNCDDLPLKEAEEREGEGCLFWTDVSQLIRWRWRMSGS